MSSSIRGVSQINSVSLGSSIVQDPVVQIGAPFDRDNARWTPVSITMGLETCEFECFFDINPLAKRTVNTIYQDGHSETCEQLVEPVLPASDIPTICHKFMPDGIFGINGMLAIGCFDNESPIPRSYQSVYCASFEKLGVKRPTSFEEFKSLIFKIIGMDGFLQHVQSAITVGEQLPTENLFAFFSHIAPTSIRTEEIRITTQEELGSETIMKSIDASESLIMAYGTKNAIYLLKDSRENALTNPYTVSFVGSFKFN